MKIVTPYKCSLSLSSCMIKCLLFTFMILCSLHLGCNAQEQENATDSDPRLPVPSDEEFASAIKTLKSIYAEEYQRVSQGDANRKRLSCATLAKKLLKDAKESSPEGGGHFAMLLEAVRFAALGETVEPSLESIDLLAMNYQVDEHALRLETLSSFAATTTRLSAVRDAAAFVIPAIRAAANFQELETAQLQMEVGEKIAKRLYDRGLQKDLAQAREVLMLLQRQAEMVASAQKKLNIDDGDVEANLIMAKFIGLRMGDWEGAEVYAAQVNEDEIRSLFVRELALPAETEELLRLGNDWWEFSETISGAEKLQAQRVAAGHYVKIFEDLKGFEQKQTELRLEEVTEEQIIPVRIPRPINGAGSSKQAPQLAIAPFDSEQAQFHQKAWAEYLGVPLETTNSIGMRFTVIPPGEFLMGSEQTDPGEVPVHSVTLTDPIELGIYEVTQEQYEKVMDRNPSNFKGPQNPVEQISWNDAVEFCRKLSELPKERAAGHVYRLPTEAEWEYACRVGTDTRYSFGDDHTQLKDYAWYDINSRKTTHPVGNKQPNPWGLYDMHGNVQEWCQDFYGNYPSGVVTDPAGPSVGSHRVPRGGCWSNISFNCRSASRNSYTPDTRISSLGFRVLRTLNKSGRAGSTGQ